jgi:hypothetical protein
MEFIIGLLGIIGLVALYFCFGIFVKFILAWWITVLGVPILIGVGFLMGWPGAIAVILGLAVLSHVNNKWHESELYLTLESKVDAVFYLSDT